jgi:hypothetical protein
MNVIALGHGFDNRRVELAGLKYGQVPERH